jgi:type IV secretion system protein VirB5
LALRPIANRYIRIDEMGRAQAIQYSDLNYSPREGEVRTYLTDWANYRYTVTSSCGSPALLRISVKRPKP